MKTYSVKVLNTGRITVDKSILTRGAGYGEKITVPVRSLAVEGNGLKMIVDTGLSADAGSYEKIAGVEIHAQETDKTMENVLESIGWKPEDVDIVVNTHLHFENCGNNSLFKNAKVLVQRKEWEFALRPVLSQKQYYKSSLLANGAGSGLNLELLDGETEVEEGLVLIPTPGHSRGHQSLLINTEGGVVCYAGHAVNLMENLSDNIIGNIVDDTKEALDSMENIRRTAEFVIPGCDAQIEANAENGFLRIHE